MHFVTSPGRERPLWLLMSMVAFAAGAGAGVTKECVYKRQARVIALLAMHSGDSCDKINQRGVQQEAALIDLTSRLNANNPELPQIKLGMYDTCSSVDQAVTAALRALVLAQQGCAGPMFLGLIGPEDPALLQAVAKVISVFHYPHVVLNAVPSYSQFSAFEVQTVSPGITARGIHMLLDELNWRSFYMAFTPDAMSSQTAQRLLESSTLCIKESSLRIPSAEEKNDYVAYNRLLYALQKGSDARVLIIADKSESATNLLTYLESVASRAKFVVYVNSVGILPWTLSQNIAKNVLVLQETTNPSEQGNTPIIERMEVSSHWQEYRNQTECNENCHNVVEDTSTRNVEYALRLFHEALKTGLDLKCQKRDVICPLLANMPASNWREHLERTTVHYKDNSDIQRKINFHMILPQYITIFSNENDDVFQSVGSITDGDSLILTSRSSLPISAQGRHEQCEQGVAILATTPAPSGNTGPPTHVRTTGMPIYIDVFGLDVHLADFGYYELVGMLCGVIVAMTVIVLLMICCVYRCFKVKQDKTFSSPSSTSRSSRSHNKNDRRRFFRRSDRSIHTVQE